jgi:hypothetical protein
MKSSIRIKTDYRSANRSPVIEINVIKSDDPRDEMVDDFIQSATLDSRMCHVELIQEGDGIKWHIVPIIIADKELKEWWLKEMKRQEKAKFSSGRGSQSEGIAFKGRTHEQMVDQGFIK